MAGGKQKQPTVSTDAVAQDMLVSFFGRWQRLEAEKTAISDDLREMFGEAKGLGFDTKVMRSVFRDKTKDHAERQEFEAIYDLYWAALGTPIATGAHPAQDQHEPANTTSPPDVAAATGNDASVAEEAPKASSAPYEPEQSTVSSGDFQREPLSVPEVSDSSRDADAQRSTESINSPVVIRFAPKDDNRPRSSEGLPRPYGCKNVDACATTWRAEQPCTLCRAAEFPRVAVMGSINE